MIDDMRRTQPRFLVLDSAWDENAADAPEGARLLDEWLAECHTEAARVETIRILAPRAAAAEAAHCAAPTP